jgi:hypothetical protein
VAYRQFAAPKSLRTGKFTGNLVSIHRSQQTTTGPVGTIKASTVKRTPWRGNKRWRPYATFILDFAALSAWHWLGEAIFLCVLITTECEPPN